MIINDDGSELYPIKNTSYYPVVEPYLTYEAQREYNYQKCVDLRFVEVCLTDLKDDLTKYGFKYVGYESGGQLWKKN